MEEFFRTYFLPASFGIKGRLVCRCSFAFHYLDDYFRVFLSVCVIGLSRHRVNIYTKQAGGGLYDAETLQQ